MLAAMEDWEADPDSEGWVLPERRLISHAAPAWDCEMVAVWCQSATGYEGDVTLPTPGPLNPQGARSMRVATLGISIVRCAPDASEIELELTGASLPSAAAVQEVAELCYPDQAHTMNALLEATKAGKFGQHQWAPLSWTPEGPDGGFAGSTLLINAGLVIAPS